MCLCFDRIRIYDAQMLKILTFLFCFAFDRYFWSLVVCVLAKSGIFCVVAGNFSLPLLFKFCVFKTYFNLFFLCFAVLRRPVTRWSRMTAYPCPTTRRSFTTKKSTMTRLISHQAHRPHRHSAIAIWRDHRTRIRSIRKRLSATCDSRSQISRIR